MEYALITLPCAACGAAFAVYTDLSNHHLTYHERPLHGAPVDAHPARWGLAALRAARQMLQVGVEGDMFDPHRETAACAQAGCVPVGEKAPIPPSLTAAFKALAQTMEGLGQAVGREPAPIGQIDSRENNVSPPVTVLGALQAQCHEAGEPCVSCRETYEKGLTPIDQTDSRDTTVPPRDYTTAHAPASGWRDAAGAGGRA